VNLFLLGAEAFKEFYSGSIHSYPMQYLYFGLHGKSALVPWMWFASALNISAFFLFLFPRTRENFTTLNMGCIFVIIGVYIEKGMGLIVPGFIPDTLGEIYEYTPTTPRSSPPWASGRPGRCSIRSFSSSRSPSTPGNCGSRRGGVRRGKSLSCGRRVQGIHAHDIGKGRRRTGADGREE